METFIKSGKIRFRPSKTANRRRNPEGKEPGRQATKRTSERTSDGFLSTVFEPLVSHVHPELADKASAERDFFTSLSNLQALYGFDLKPMPNRVYPLNIALAYKQAKEALKRSNPGLSLNVIQDDTHAATLATIANLEPEYTLYFLTLKPLWTISRDKTRRKTRNLLYSVYGYLKQIIGIGNFVNSPSYVCGSYEMYGEQLQEYIYECREVKEDYSDHAEDLRNLKKVLKIGRQMDRHLNNPYHLKTFAYRVKCYKPANAEESGLLTIARKVLNLYQTYGVRSLNDSFYGLWNNDELDSPMTPDDYLSFMWDDDSSLYENLMQDVNCHFQNTSAIIIPKAIQYFHEPQASEQHDLSFESALFILPAEIETCVPTLIESTSTEPTDE